MELKVYLYSIKTALKSKKYHLTPHSQIKYVNILKNGHILYSNPTISKLYELNGCKLCKSQKSLPEMKYIQYT